MRIAIAQMNSTPDLGKNLEQVRKMTSEAAGSGADLVVFPEATQTPFGSDLVAVAEELDGQWATSVSAIARDNSVTVVSGMFRPGTDGTVVNTLFATGVDPDGNAVQAHYDKIHLYDAFGHKESRTVTPGGSVRSFRFAGLRIGFAICYDIRFPALFTSQARAGADLIIVAASWGNGPGKVEQWELLGRARALDSTTFIVACGQADPATTGVPAAAGSPTGVGRSYASGPDGTILVQCGTGTEIAYVTVDQEDLTTIRSNLPVLENSRLEGSVSVDASGGRW